MAELRVKSTGTLKLFESDNTSSVTIASPASLGGDRTITLPDASVTLASGTMLATDGSGASLTALNASELGSGTVPTARLGSGTASSSTVLYGDQTYKAEPAGSRVLLLTTTLSDDADLEINNTYITSTYKKYEIDMIQCQMEDDGTYLSLLGSTDNGTSYPASSGYQTTMLIMAADYSADAIKTRPGTASTQIIIIGNAESVANDKVFDAHIQIFDPTSTTDYKNVIFLSVQANPDDHLIANWGGACFLDAGTTAVDCIKLVSSSGNLTSGIVKLYGCN